MKKIVQTTGIILALLYGMSIVWLYVRQPRTFAEMKTQVSVEANTYTVKQENFNEALKQFNTGQYLPAIEQFKLADPAEQDATTQFYIAYCFYMLGRGRFYDDNDMFTKGLAAIERCIAVAPNHIFEIDRADLDIKNADALRARLKEGSLHLNPFNWFKKAK